jgi:orotidine-5'-phosphate decarboxylase
MVKTHIDIISFPSVDAIRTFTSALTDLSKKHNFLIFEDRKFADIGSTVQHQYRGGVYNIASWAHITNAHSFPGPGIVTGLGEVMLKEVKEPRGLLLLAEMSSAGNLSTEGEYRQKTLRMAREHKDVVCGFIAMGNQIITESGDDSDDFIFMTPGVNLADKGDAHGQQYQSPEFVIGEKKSDIIIVGRGIIKAEDPVAVAEKYRAAGWEAYEKRTVA